MDEKLYTDDFKASVYTSFTIPPQRSILASDRTNGDVPDIARFAGTRRNLVYSRF